MPSDERHCTSQIAQLTMKDTKTVSSHTVQHTANTSQTAFSELVNTEKQTRFIALIMLDPTEVVDYVAVIIRLLTSVRCHVQLDCLNVNGEPYK